MITLLATLFGVWYRFTLICIYACNQSHLKIQPQIKSASLLSKQQSIDTAPFHKHAQARKRLRTDPHTAVSDLGAPSQDKRSKESSSPWLPVSTPNKEQQLARLPNTLYFKSLKLKIKHDPNSPLAESILEKLDAFHKLKLPYTFLSSTLRSCTHLHILDTLLNKTLMKSAKGRYAIETKLQHILNNNIKLSNLSSMVSGSGNTAAQAFETLVNRLTGQEMLHKIQTLKHLGITPSNLSSMVNGSGNTAAQAFETVINRLTDQETVHKIEILKKQGIQFNHLSAMLAKSATKASDALINVIDLLNNDQYIETMQKVTAELYSKSDVINQNDAILVSRQASIVLHGIGNLKKQPSIIDPSNHPKFKRFLTDCYNNNKYVDDRLMEIKKVTDDDSRIELHGQDKVVAKKKIIKGTVLGIYTGILLCDEALDNAVELAYLSTKNIYGLNKLNSYSFYLDLVTPTPLYLSACGRGNMLIKINANQTYSRTSTQSSRSNVTASWNSCDGHTPFILFYATEHIPATQELLFDYGKQYWDHHGNNNDLSNPDAQIYRALLSTKKYLDQASSIRFLRLIQAHDHDLYRNLLTHLMTPIHTFSGKDRLVECRNLFSFTKQQRDYRIYKLPGEKSSAAAPEDYFSINWDPAVSLDALDQYNWSGA